MDTSRAVFPYLLMSYSVKFLVISVFAHTTPWDKITFFPGDLLIRIYYFLLYSILLIPFLDLPILIFLYSSFKKDKNIKSLILSFGKVIVSVIAIVIISLFLAFLTLSPTFLWQIPYEPINF